jgi:sterol 14-demethylase
VTGWRIRVDEDLCQGHGVCESEAPDVFEVTKERKVGVLLEQPADELRRGVEAAVKYCPTHALRIEEAQEPIGGQDGPARQEEGA